MRKILFLTLIICGINLTCKAQEVGIRFGNFSGSNVAIDGVFSLGKYSRIHSNLAFGNGGVGIDFIWDFWHQQIGGEQSLSWYAGVGPTVFLANDFHMGASGEIGIEYHFTSAPIAIGFDWRPYFQIVDNTNFHADNIALNLRFCF